MGLYPVANMSFVYAQSTPELLQYTNWTGIGGIIGANSAQLAEYWGDSAFGLRMDADFELWGWNPLFNNISFPSI
jgi:hypothetical protein